MQTVFHTPFLRAIFAVSVSIWLTACSPSDTDENKNAHDRFHLEYAIDSAAELMQPYIPAYPDTYPVNQENLNIYQEEARTFLLGMLKLTEDEIQILYPEEDGSGYVSFTEIEQLMELAKERLKEEGYHESEE